MSLKKEEPKAAEIPDVVVDPSTQKRYVKGRFLGKGGFAKCYELTDAVTKQVFAGKIVPKTLLVKPHQREKMTQEINIHRGVNHKHIVGFHGFFEDNDNVYILLELCRRRSLMELHKRRRAVTEPEGRYFVHQVVLAVDYLHKNHIIHRDLKLGNLFLNDEMEIKIGDFGLATRVDYEGERKKTLCGTPNYIAPEVLGKKGHSYEVDAWSLGCILYTLLLGKPPFETSCLKDTYTRIKKNEYHIPPAKMSPCAKRLIEKLLQADPTQRPTMEQVLHDEFFTTGFLPAGLPTSCLTMAPRFDTLKPADVSRRPLCEINEGAGAAGKDTAAVVCTDGAAAMALKAELEFKRTDGDEPTDCYLSELLALLVSVKSAKILDKKPVGVGDDDAEDPAAVPIYWVSKWVDYSDKYGLGYQLCDNSVGVLFNDSTRIILTTCGENLQYIERDGTEFFHTLRFYPEALNKKITLLNYFRNYMSEHLLKAGANITPREGDEMTRLPFLRTWFRTRSAIILHLSNGTLQINFFQDHTKVIVCPLMGAVTYIDDQRVVRTYRLPLIEKFGCSKELSTRLGYARAMCERLVSAKSGSGGAPGGVSAGSTAAAPSAVRKS
jgi:polo-like kinase 1